MKINSVYSFQMNGWNESELITGIYINEGDEWR